MNEMVLTTDTKLGMEHYRKHLVDHYGLSPDVTWVEATAAHQAAMGLKYAVEKAAGKDWQQMMAVEESLQPHLAEEAQISVEEGRRKQAKIAQVVTDIF